MGIIATQIISGSVCVSSYLPPLNNTTLSAAQPWCHIVLASEALTASCAAQQLWCLRLLLLSGPCCTWQHPLLAGKVGDFDRAATSQLQAVEQPHGWWVVGEYQKRPMLAHESPRHSGSHAIKQFLAALLVRCDDRLIRPAIEAEDL